MKHKKLIVTILLFTLLCSLVGCGSTRTQLSEEGTISNTDLKITNISENSIRETTGQDSLQIQKIETVPKAADISDDGIVDLTVLSSTMVYSEVYNMMVMPENYVGKTVKIDGAFAVYEGDNRNYYACVIADATACCSQGIEFVWNGEHSYPEDYPELGSEIIVQGIFDTYEEDGYLYCQLIDAEVDSAK